jgi:hypothetical protein
MTGICVFRNFLKSTVIFVTFVVVAGLACSCSSRSQNPDDEISEEVILKIGNMEITQYEFQKDFERGLGKNISKQNKEEWLKEFINNKYLIADALEKKYDTIADINNILEYASRTMMSKVDGYLWNAVELPKMKITKEQIVGAYEKRKYIFYLDVLVFANKFTMKQTLGKDTTPDSSAKFKSLVDRLDQNDKTVVFLNFSSQWPYDEGLSEFPDLIYNLKEDEVSKPVETNNGIYIIHLLRKEEIKQKPLKKELKTIEPILITARKNQIAFAKQNEIHKNANIKINDAIVDSVSATISNLTFLSRPSLSKKIIMSYSINNLSKSLSVSAFIDYSTNNPLRFLVETKVDIYHTLDNIVMENYLFNEAEQLGVTKNRKYLLDKKHFLHGLIKTRYEMNEFSRKIIVPPAEIEAYYNTHKKQFTGAQTCVITVLTFKNESQAYNSLSLINSLIMQNKFDNLSDTSVIKGLISCEKKIKIDAHNKKFSKEIVDKIFSMPVNKVQDPIACQNKTIVIYKINEEGTRLIPLKEVESKINQQLFSEKFLSMRKIRLNELAAKYKISVNKIKI